MKNIHKKKFFLIIYILFFSVIELFLKLAEIKKENWLEFLVLLSLSFFNIDS